MYPDPLTFPREFSWGAKDITVWCSNDYLGMSAHPAVKEAVKLVINFYDLGTYQVRYFIIYTNTDTYLPQWFEGAEVKTGLVQ